MLQEILEWSRDRPPWQRDALRRLAIAGDLTEKDLHALTELCKAEHGLADPQSAVPLAGEHIPSVSGSASVSLASIYHHCGVNALAEKQTLKVGPQLTVVYGDNGAGKTGYIRILKGACRARGREQILGNVVSGAAPQRPVVSIKYRLAPETADREWVGNGHDDHVSRVSVFDTHSAAVYLTEKTDVAFRPLGLDLFDKLVKACKGIRSRLENEQRALSADGLASLKGVVPQGTSVDNLLSGLSSLTKPERVGALASLTDQEATRLEFLEKSLVDLQANNPEKLIQQLSLRAGRARTFAKQLGAVESALSPAAIDALFALRAEGRRKSEEARRLRELALSGDLLKGTGSDEWKMLWSAARTFSTAHAYPDQAYPVTVNDAHCVLCQQVLGAPAAERLRQFESFAASTTERELRSLRERFANARTIIANLAIDGTSVDEFLRELQLESDQLAETVGAALRANSSRRELVLSALSADCDLPAECPPASVVSHLVESLANQIDDRIKTLRLGSASETRQSYTAEVQELRARKLLEAHQQAVIEEIERKKRHAAYSLCIDATKTHAITQKSTAVTKAVVSARLKQSFAEELTQLEFKHVEVELREVGGAEGVLYHKLVLTRAPGVDLPKVVSEGEQRCLSIAAFFAELTTADELSAIVFDDPVSSLDYRWRDGVARRLVREAKSRQVIVFTHDVVFLLLIKKCAEEYGVAQADQHIRRLPGGTGVCAEELPWVALKVAKRIGHLKKLFQDAEKLHRDGHVAAYERDASMIYGYLREAWERGIEEVLLGGVVERYRPGVQTQQVAEIADICPADCAAVEIAMTKCSKWLPGHDQAAAAREDVPEPNMLKADIEALEAWVSGIRSRRRK